MYRSVIEKIYLYDLPAFQLNCECQMVLTNCFTFQNPNLRPQRQKKVTELNTATSSKTQLTRREREEIEKQKAKAHYQVLIHKF